MLNIATGWIRRTNKLFTKTIHDKQPKVNIGSNNGVGSMFKLLCLWIVFIFFSTAAAAVPPQWQLHKELAYAIHSSNFQEVKKILPAVIFKEDHWLDVVKNYVSHSNKKNFAMVEVFLDSGVDLSYRTDDIPLVLFQAIKSNNIPLIEILLKFNANPNILNKKHLSPLQVVNLHHSQRNTMVKLLIQSGANVHVRDHNGISLMMQYVKKVKDKALFQLLLDHHADINARTAYFSMLGNAVNEEAIEFIQWLLDKGADPNLSDEHGKTPLMVASSLGYANITSLLLAHGAEVDSRDTEQKTALHYAASEGKQGVLALLLKHGANPAVLSKNNFTPLHLAIIQNHGAVVSSLARFSKLTEIGDKTPMMMALIRGHTEFFQQMLKQGATLQEDERWNVVFDSVAKNSVLYDTVVNACIALNDKSRCDLSFLAIEVLRNNYFELAERISDHTYIDVERRDTQKDTILIKAARRGHVLSVKFLVRYGAKINAQNKEGETAFFEAARLGHMDVVKFLLEFQADIERENNRGTTPIIAAVSRKQKQVVRFLLEHGVDVNHMSRGKDTALIQAVITAQPDMVELLLEHSADTDVQLDQASVTAWAYDRKSNPIYQEIYDSLKKIRFFGYSFNPPF